MMDWRALPAQDVFGGNASAAVYSRLLPDLYARYDRSDGSATIKRIIRLIRPGDSKIPPETFILIPGRTSDQGCGISEGKFLEKYQTEINTLQVAAADMTRLGLQTGQRVRLTSETGQVEVTITAAKGDELPAGLLFIAYGDASCRLMAGDTHGSGMPTSKGIDVTMEPVN